MIDPQAGTWLDAAIYIYMLYVQFCTFLSLNIVYSEYGHFTQNIIKTIL